MYQKPSLQRFGSLRALTLVGLGVDGDGFPVSFLSQSPTDSRS